MVRRLLLVLLLGWAPAAEAAADAGDAIEAAEARVGAAEAALAAAEAEPVHLARLAEAVSAYEGAVAALSGGAAQADGRTLALEDGFVARRTEIMRLVAALEAISRTPVPQRGIHPDGPLGAARAAAMMDRLEPALRKEAGALAGEVVALKAARSVEARGAAALAAAEARLAIARSKLAAAMAAAVPPVEGPEVSALTMVARDSDTLTALAAALARTGDAPAAPAPGSAAPLLWPVAGAVTRHFDEPDAAGVRRPGIVVGAPALAIVKAPADAVVRYAGPFLEYGYVTVLEPDGTSMIVLAGLAQLQVRTGASVKRGDLLGLMGGRSPDVEESVSPGGDTGTGPEETLYIEIRQGRGPVDPEPLFQGDSG
jgi:murein hydrolase activator